MDATKSAHERILAQLNALLVQKESVTGAVRRELDATKAEKERAERQVELDAERIEQLERALAERDTYIKELETDLKSHGELLQRVSEESERDASTMREKLRAADARAEETLGEKERL